MANSLGAIVVKLGLDAAEFTSGLTKAEYQAKRFADSLSTDIASGVRTVAGLLGGLAIGSQLISSTRAILDEANALNDLADITGSTVEQLSALRNQAYIAGADMGTLTTALSKLSQGMAGTDEESTKTKEALKALGITTRDPAEAFRQVAVALEGYRDGVNKTGIAVALFGKQGAALLPVMKDIVELQEVGATMTKQQTDEAERLGKEYRRLTVEATAFKDILLSGVVPALNQVLERFRLAQGQGAGFFKSLDYAMRGQEEIADNIATLDRNIAGLQQRLDAYRATTSSKRPFFAEEVAAMEADLAKARKTRSDLQALRKPLENDFGPPVLPGSKPDAPSGFGGSKDSKAARDKVSEADRYLESLRKQLEGTLDLSEAEKVLREVQVGRLKDASHGQIDAALALAQEIDATKAAEKAEKERLRTAEESARLRERISQMATKEIETAQQVAASLRDSNDRQGEQLILLRDGEAALDAYIDKKNAKSAAELRDKAAMLENAGAAQALIDATKAQAAEYERARSIAGATRFVETIKKEAEAIKALQQDVFGIGAHAVEDLILNGAKASDVLKQLERDLVAFMTRQSLLTLQSAVIPGSAGPTLWDVLGKVVGAAIGGYSVPSGGIAPGFGFGDKYAAGTMSAKRGLALVGENGPEIVSFGGGERVYSNAESRSMLGSSTTINQHINVMPGANTESARQAAAKLRDVTMWAVRDR